DRQLAGDACRTLLELWQIDVFVYMDAPQNVLDERRHLRGNTDYFENQDSEFHHRVRAGYEEGLALLKSNQSLAGVVVEIDGADIAEQIHQQIMQTVAR